MPRLPKTVLFHPARALYLGNLIYLLLYIYIARVALIAQMFMITLTDSAICFCTENANAANDSGIRAKEARCENRTHRRGARQVSPKIPLT